MNNENHEYDVVTSKGVGLRLRLWKDTDDEKHYLNVFLMREGGGVRSVLEGAIKEADFKEIVNTPSLVRCFVVCRNSNGVPDYFMCKVLATPTEVASGRHYDAASLASQAQGLEDVLVCDEHDTLFNAVGPDNDWDYVPCYNINGNMLPSEGLKWEREA